MKFSGAVIAVVIVGVCLSAEIDPTLDSQCQSWISGQKDLVMLNQVAAGSKVSSCADYCFVAGAGSQSETTACRSMCDRAGGFQNLLSAFSASNGNPAELCRSILSKSVQEPTLVSFVEVGSSNTRSVGVRGDMTVQGTLTTAILTSPIGDVKVSGQLSVMNSIDATSARAAYMKADSGLSVSQGIISKKDQLLIKGKIDASSVTSDSFSASFLEIGGVRQWALQSLEDFEEVGADGWSHGEITNCGGQHLLGGHCVEREIKDLTKTYNNLPPHTQLRINAKYMFIDSWDGESGYMKIDGNTVWVESYNHADGDSKKGINICGNPTPERRFGRPIDVTIPHTGSSVTLQFGATTDEHSCDESFGIDSVMLFTR